MTSDLAALFSARYGAAPRLFRAPGRVNVIGEHTDYNDGFVMPAAINFATYVAAAPRTDGRLRVFSENLNEEITVEIAAAQPRRHWSDYVVGVAALMESAGADLYVRGEVPLGAGLSSSAAIEVSTAFALTTLAGRTIDRRAIALLCQRAEGEFVGMRCGIMDQFIAAHGVAHHAIELDCRSLAYRAVPLPEGVRLVIANTMVKHELASGEYNRRRASCEEAAQALGVKALRDATLPQLEAGKAKMSETAYRRARHIIGENARVEAAVDAFGRNRLAEVGDLMAASHRSLRDDYEVSCAELDLMVHLASDKPGCLGARMTGGGFGGSTVNLVEEQHAEAFRAAVAAEYEARTGVKPAIYICDAVEGASEIA